MIARVAHRLSLRLSLFLLALAGSAFAAEKVVLLAEQSTGGKISATSAGVQSVVLDKSCTTNFPKTADARIVWKLPAALPAGWWRIVAESTLNGTQYSNRNIGVGFATAQKPVVNVEANLTPAAGTPQRLECWIYSASPIESVMLQPSNEQWLYNATWPVSRITLDQTSPTSLTPQDAVTFDLTVKPDGIVELPLPLPAGNYSVSLGAKKPGSTVLVGEDKRTIEAPFAFDRWKRPRTSYFHAGSSVREITLRRDKTDTAFKSILLTHTVARTYTPHPIEGKPIVTVDPTRTETASLTLIGSGLNGQLPSFTLLPRGLKNAVLTTWDDGKPEDLRCAEILHKHGYRPSFFLNHNSKAMEFLDKLQALNVEIGSHCFTHPSLYQLPPERAAEECLSMRVALEQKLGHPVISMGYPNGYFPSMDADGDYVLRAVKAAGIWSARTTNTRAERIDTFTDLAAMDTDGFFGFAKELTAQWTKTREIEGGVFHFWGHSWQIGKTEEHWTKFDTFVAQFANQPGVWYASQGELSLWRWARENVKITAEQPGSTKSVVKLTRPWLHPHLSAQCPLTLQVPAGVTKVIWQDKEIPVTDGRVELAWSK